MLILSVSIEGILNDIFIPKISSDVFDSKFEEEKKTIISTLKQIDSLQGTHIRSLTTHVKRWGNVHPEKALTYLVKKNVIEERHRKTWLAIRHSSAHPKLVLNDEDNKRKDIKRLVICLGLFYRLILNVFSYKGPQYAFEKPGDTKLVSYEYVNVLQKGENGTN